MAKKLYGEATGIPKSATPNPVTMAPNNSYPERPGTYYERKAASPTPGRRGPARFYEGLGSDRDIPREFSNGAMQGYETAPGHPNHNKNVYEKLPAETMAERAHAGSASWTESPTFMGDFAHGADSVRAERKYECVNRGAPNPSGRRYERVNPAEIND
jgi:hypothetical protein